MSAIALEEMRESNIYYILGITFISGISATFYLIMDASNKNFSISTENEAEIFSFTESKSSEQSAESIKNDLESLKTSIASVAEQKEGSIKDKAEKMVWKICQHFEISQALIYTQGKEKGQYTLTTSYAFVHSDKDPKILSGEGLTGQAVIDQAPYYIKEIPEGYLKVVSGLGESLPRALLIIPCVEQGEVKSVFELSSLHEYSKNKFEEIVETCNYISSLLK